MKMERTTNGPSITPAGGGAEALRLLSGRLTPRYGAAEARAIAFVVLEDAFGLSRTAIYAGKVSQFPADAWQRLLLMCRRLEAGEPVQYVVGTAPFCGRTFHVEPGVLIPRPETELLAAWAASLAPEGPVLDAGTGSGCLAVTIALDCPAAEVTACDLSPVALRVAADNARRLGARVRVTEADMLRALPPAPGGSGYSLIVSNPPYIREAERSGMEANVLDHEPAMALFVPDDDPLRFYRALAQWAVAGALAPGGWLLTEVNRAYADDVAALYAHCGLTSVEVRRDQFGNARMVGARRV